MVEAVVDERFIACPFTEPEVTAAIDTLNVAPTSAVINKELVSRVAKATTVESIVAEPLSLVIIRTKNDELIDAGLVIVVYGMTIAVPEPTEEGEVTVSVNVPLLAKFVVLVPNPVSDPCTPVVVTIPDGVTQEPDGAVQYCSVIVWIVPVVPVVKLNM
jgi:hypothetical protein